MPHLVCPRCQRANPHEAVYCHFDGVELRAAAGPARQSLTHLPHEFVFPSGRRCHTYDDLGVGCQEEWAEARGLLQKGVFAQFLTGTGRMDLVQAAHKAQAHADPDIGLHFFINSLPATKTEGPRLDLQPRRLALGTLHTGETRQVHLTVLNEGKGLLHGTLSIAAGDEWLSLTESNGKGQCTLKTAKEQQVTLRVDTAGLAAPKTYSTKLTVITNGGIVEVPVSLDLAAFPFPRPPFIGAGSPREIAELMRKQPKPAVALLESGEVQRWFTANGWTYPVNGPTAKGVAAVQQFFEGMGLSKPPPLQLSDEELHFTLVQPDVVQGKTILYTGVKKWVYASLETDAPWLRLTSTVLSGPQQAVIGFEVDSSLMDANRIHQGTVVITANAGQTLTLQVRVDVRRGHEPFTRRLLRPFLVSSVLALIFRLLLAGPADLYARVLAAEGPEQGAFRMWLQSPLREETAASYVKHFVLATWWIGAVAGALVLWKRRSALADVGFGAIAGAAAGVWGSATLACLLALVDGLPRTVWHGLDWLIGGSRLAESAWICTPFWIVLAAGCWGLLGLAVGLGLRLLGGAGTEMLTRTAAPLAWMCGVVGLKRGAAFFALQ